MKAALYKGEKQLVTEELPDPVPGPGELLVRIAGCGVCQTDLHYTDHGVPTAKTPPLVLGHEPSGVVAGLGEGVTAFKEGDRVLIPPVTYCGECENCKAGRENICTAMEMFGNHRNGAFAELMTAPANICCPLPDELPLEESSIIADAVSTPYHAVVNRAKVQPGQKVVVIGCGGVGINGVQVAAALGAEVVAVDIDEKKLALAKELGAAHTLNPSGEEKPAKALKKLTGGGAHVALECIGRPDTQALALDCLRVGGTAVMVGFADRPATLNTGKVMFYELSVIGSLGCPPRVYPDIVEMVRTGKLRLKPLVTHKFPLEQVNEAFDTLRRGETIRTVVTP